MSRQASVPFDYAAFVGELTARICAGRLAAAHAVNTELVSLYWDIGAAIREKQATLGWGDGVVDRLARDLKRAFPDATGFSPSNLWRMRQLHEAYTAPEFLAQAVREITLSRRAAKTAPAGRLSEARYHREAVRQNVECEAQESRRRRSDLPKERDRSGPFAYRLEKERPKHRCHLATRYEAPTIKVVAGKPKSSTCSAKAWRSSAPPRGMR